jgi:hypothetical protein
MWRRRRHHIDRWCSSSFSGSNPLRWASIRFSEEKKLASFRFRSPVAGEGLPPMLSAGAGLFSDQKSNFSKLPCMSAISA